MMSILLMIAVLFPILSGIGLFKLHNAPEKTRRIFAFGAVALTSVLTLLSLLFAGEEPFTPVTFSESLSFSLRVDGLGAFFAGMAAFLWPLAILYAFVYLKEDPRKSRFYAFYVMTYGVVLGIAFAANALTLYVFYELLTFITLPLITHTETKEARRAGRMYLYYSLSGSSLALAGIVILTVTTGSNAFVFGGLTPENPDLAAFAYLLTFIGFGVKAAIFPLSRWLPAASAAPTPTTALLHAVAVVKSGAFAVIRMTFYASVPALLSASYARNVAVVLASLSVVYGSAMALREQHIKRRFAYSTVSNLSYILLGTLMATPEGLVGALLHFLFHSVTKIGVFFLVGALMETAGVKYVYEVNGLGKKYPALFVLFTVSGLSLIGIPPFACFISKFYLLRAFLSEGVVGAVSAGAIILSALLTAAYVLPVSFRAFVRTPNEYSRPYLEKEAKLDRGFLFTAGFFSVCALLFGLFSGVIERIVSQIAGGAV